MPLTRAAFKRVLQQFLEQLKDIILSPFITVWIHIVTLPYYRVYQFNTIGPLRKIALLAAQSQDSPKLLRALALWRGRKLTELQFISISCAILAAAVIGAFSWTSIEDAYWLTHGFWHSSLVLSVLGILLSASQVTVLHVLGPLPHPRKTSRAQYATQRYLPLMLSKSLDGFTPRRKMVFTWQCPIMFMSYSVCAFLAGLTIYVCTPLIRRKGEWNPGCNIAVMYLSVCAIAATLFVFCSYWVYQYVDLDFDAKEEGEGEDITRMEMSPPRDDMGPSTFGVRTTGAMLERLESRISSSGDERYT